MIKSVLDVNTMEEFIKKCKTIYLNDNTVKNNWKIFEEINPYEVEIISWEKKNKTLHLKKIEIHEN